MAFQKESIEQALAVAESLKNLFEDIGSQKNQDTPIYHAFLLAKRILKSNRSNVGLIKIQLESLFSEISRLVNQYLLVGQDIGLVHLDNTVTLFGLLTPQDPTFDNSIHDSIMMLLRQQLMAIFAAIQTGEKDDELLFGGDDFWGVLSPLPITKETKNWSATIAGLMVSLGLEGLLDEPKWRYQAVAVIDRLTTNTCLFVHGQTQEIGSPFQLEGHPRYGDEILKPPFHDHCRTSRALIEAKDASSSTTVSMEERAEDEIIRRKEK